MRNALRFPGCVAAIALLAGAAPVLAADKENCGKHISAKGSNKIEAVASLSAIRLWSQIAEKQNGPDYAMWHNAAKKRLKCSYAQKSEYILCFARGSPCKASGLAENTTPNTR